MTLLATSTQKCCSPPLAVEAAILTTSSSGYFATKTSASKALTTSQQFLGKLRIKGSSIASSSEVKNSIACSTSFCSAVMLDFMGTDLVGPAKPLQPA